MSKMQRIAGVAFFLGLITPMPASATECAKNLTASSSVSSIIQCLKDQETEIAALKLKKGPKGDKGDPGEKGDPGNPAVLPRGAVLAFERDDLTAETCPDGWQPYKNARGRMIVGAGDPSESEGKFGFDEAGNRLTHYVMRQHGGAETHALDVDEMPDHAHRAAPYDNPGRGFLVHTGPNQVRLSGPDGPIGTLTDVELTTGGVDRERRETLPHNNMPPYIALYFCKKEG